MIQDRYRKKGWQLVIFGFRLGLWQLDKVRSRFGIVLLLSLPRRRVNRPQFVIFWVTNWLCFCESFSSAGQFGCFLLDIAVCTRIRFQWRQPSVCCSWERKGILQRWNAKCARNKLVEQSIIEKPHCCFEKLQLVSLLLSVTASGGVNGLDYEVDARWQPRGLEPEGIVGNLPPFVSKFASV